MTSLEETNIKHCQITCRFELDIGSGTAGKAGDLTRHWTDKSLNSYRGRCECSTVFWDVTSDSWVATCQDIG